MNATSLYITTLLVYALVNIIGVLGLNLQFGFSGIANFAYITYVSVGGYVYGLLTLGSPSGQSYQHYFAGARLPFPLPFVFATLAGCLVGALTGLLLLRRLRDDYQSVAFFALSFVALGLATGLPDFVNGANGLSLIPAPLASHFSTTGASYGWFYVVLALVVTIACFWLLQRLTRSPWGRLLRAVQENEIACRALGKNPGVARYAAFIVGCGFAALSGALLVGFLTTWGPAAWTLPETVVFFTALVVGGIGSNWGATVGVVLVAVVIGQAALYLPAFVSATTLSALQWIVIGGLTLAFIWFRPRGLIPARVPKHRRPVTESVPAQPVSAESKDVHHSLSRGEGEAVAVTRPSRSANPERPFESAMSAAGSVQPLLEIRGLARSFGGVQAVSGVDFDVLSGTIVGLMGPNGAGKSTLVGMLAGELSASDGSIRYASSDITKLGASARARQGLIRTFQLSSEFRQLSVLENLLVGQRDHPGERLSVALMRRRWMRMESEALDRAWSLLDEFHLSSFANERAGALSGGQRRLVELMRAMMAAPRMLLLDEPLAGISRSTGAEFLDVLAGLRAKGLTILLVEHELHALHQLADRVVVMARGRKIADGRMREIVDLPEVIQSYVAG